MPTPTDLALASVKQVRVDFLRQALAGDHKALPDAFLWSSTPQKSHHWADRYDANDTAAAQMDTRDYAFLALLLQYHEGENQP